MTPRPLGARLSGTVAEQRAVRLERATVLLDVRQFDGHAAVYNQRAAIGDLGGWGFLEQVATGAFDKSIRDGDVVQLSDHDPAKPISRMSAGTLRLKSDSIGLDVNSDIVATSYGDDLIANVRAGNVAGMSFGFQVVQDDWSVEQVAVDERTLDVEVRTLLEVKLIEVSTTAFPAYTGTDAGVRSIRAARQSRRARGGLWSFNVPTGRLAAIGDEIRLGAALSAANLATLQDVLDYIATADDAVDAAQPLLASLMGVPNPDADDGTDDDGDDGSDETETDSAFPLDLAIRHRELAERYALTI